MLINEMTVYATPVKKGHLKNVADHTFIICDNIRFGCWGTSNKEDPDAREILSVKGENYLKVIKQYGGIFDTGNLGMYSINGVCHQSANLFLFATKKKCMPLNANSPHGLLATYLLYSPYGTNFLSWLITNYMPAYLYSKYINYNEEKIFEIPEINDKFISELILNNIPKESLEYKICNNHIKTDNNSIDYIVKDMSVLLKQTLNIDDYSISKTHTEILKEKEQLLAQYELTNNTYNINKLSISKDDIINICNKLNQLSVNLQSELKQKIKSENYIKCNGNENFYNPINPDIAVAMLNKK